VLELERCAAPAHHADKPLAHGYPFRLAAEHGTVGAGVFLTHLPARAVARHYPAFATPHRESHSAATHGETPLFAGPKHISSSRETDAMSSPFQQRNHGPWAGAAQHSGRGVADYLCCIRPNFLRKLLALEYPERRQTPVCVFEVKTPREFSVGREQGRGNARRIGRDVPPSAS